jgi:hypothetical protein
MAFNAYKGYKIGRRYMDREGFVKFLKTRNLSEQEIEEQISIVRKFENCLKKLEKPKTLKSANASNFAKFSALMTREKLNTYDNYIALARYGKFVRNNRLYLAAISLIDGAEAMDTLFSKLGKTVGDMKRDEIFKVVDIPPLGTPNAEKTKAMKAVLKKMESMLDSKTCKKILGSGLRILEDRYYLEEKQKYEKAGNIDRYLKIKGDDFIKELAEIKKNKGLYFNQEITDEVIEFVEKHPEIRQGVRKGDIIYETKIPYQAKEYIAEKDDNKKRYYYCHCPWVKESLKKGRTDTPAVFCNCSAAFHKKPYDVIFGKPVRAEVMESIVKGDLQCRFAIYLPEDYKTGKHGR